MKRLIFLVMISSLMSCSSHKSKFFTSTVLTMKEVFEKKFHTQQGLTREDIKRPVGDGEQDLNRELKAELKTLRKQFNYLPNPILPMFIYSHLTDAGTPVPGYSTYFKFYRVDQVALPGEAARVLEH